MIIYIDLGCSDGVTVSRFLQGASFLPELGSQCDRVYAFDPIRDPQWGLIGDVVVMPTATTRIEWYECAVGTESGLTWLAMTENPEARTAIPGNENYESAIMRKVKVIDFCEWFKNAVRFEDTVIVKMDIEGAEYGILEALMATSLIKRINHLFVEFHSFCMNEDSVNDFDKREERIRANCPIEIGAWA